MPATAVKKDDVYVLNYCTKSLARDNDDFRHNMGQCQTDDVRGRIAEAWRFPIVDSYYDATDPESDTKNIVTFVCVNRSEVLGRDIGVIGTFADLHSAIPLSQAADSIFWAVTIIVPKGQSHRYKFIAGGRAMLDPVNPQCITRQDGSQWSRFFTDYCTDILVLEQWEAAILERLTDHILPFRTVEGQRFLNYYYNYLDKQTKETQYSNAYRLDQPVGVVNLIDKLLARQESHRLIDYRICLAQIDRVLRSRYPRVEPAKLPPADYDELYAQMAAIDGSRIPGWDYSAYSSPRFFLQLLRRHTFTGAFSHPKHGGNSGAAGWEFLATNLNDPKTGQLPILHATTAPKSYFDWRRSLEPPLGRNPEYRG
jgi:hypothetical protein